MSVYFLGEVNGLWLCPGFLFCFFFASNVEVIVFLKNLIPVYGKV